MTTVLANSRPGVWVWAAVIWEVMSALCGMLRYGTPLLSSRSASRGLSRFMGHLSPSDIRAGPPLLRDVEPETEHAVTRNARTAGFEIARSAVRAPSILILPHGQRNRLLPQ